MLCSVTAAEKTPSVLEAVSQQYKEQEQAYDVVVLGSGVLAASIFYNLSSVTSNVCLIADHVSNNMYSSLDGLVYCFHPDKTLLEKTSMSWAYYKRFGQHTGIECALTTTGFLYFPKPRHMNIAKEAAENISKVPMCWMDIDKLQMHFGSLLNSNLYGAVYEPLSGYMDPQSVANAWIQAGVANGGKVLQGTLVQNLLYKNNKLEAVATTKGKIKSPKVIVASQANTADLLDKFQIPHQIQQQTICIDNRLPERPLHNHPAYVDECNQICGRSDLQTNNMYIEYPENLGSNCGTERWRWVKTSSKLKTQKISAYTTPNNNELVANTETENLYVATCSKGLEFRIAPWIGQKIASIINTN